MDKGIVSDLTFSNNEVAVYCALRNLMKKEQDNYGATINQLLYYATGRGNHSSFEKDCFIDGMKKLIAKNLISVEFSFGVQDRILNLSSLHIKKEHEKTFVSIDLCEIRTILGNCKTNRYAILRYFILLVGTFNPKIEVTLINGKKTSNVIGNMPIHYLCQLTGLSESTIIDYNKQLEKLELIYIYHSKDFYRTSENTIKSPSNVYSRYCDKEFVEQFVKNEAVNKGYHIFGKEIKTETNHKRRLAQRYNRIISGSHPYTKEEVQEVYDYILAANQKYQLEYEKSKWEPFKEKLRDLSKLENILKKGNKT